MEAPKPIHSSRGCEIGEAPGYLRGVIGPGSAKHIQDCYRLLVLECLKRQSKRTLVIGLAGGDAFTHLAARDAIRSMVLAGVPVGYRVAFVALGADLIAVYDAAVVEAARRGIEARRFREEAEAIKWLASPP
jgi:hypothetical protein